MRSVLIQYDELHPALILGSYDKYPLARLSSKAAPAICKMRGPSNSLVFRNRLSRIPKEGAIGFLLEMGLKAESQAGEGSA